jgi:hypothetical protein
LRSTITRSKRFAQLPLDFVVERDEPEHAFLILLAAAP